MSIFNEGDNTPSPQQDDPQSSNPVSDKSFDHLLDGIKNEKGERKYKDLETAMNALQHSQQYIPEVKSEVDSLSAENQLLKEKLEKLNNLESVVEKLTAKEAQDATPAPAGLDEQTVEQLLEQKLSQREQSQTKASNLKTVTDTLKSQYGTEADKTFYQKAEELGIPKETFEALAETSPKAVLAYFPKAAPAPSVTTGHNSAGFNASTQKEGPLAAPEKSILAGASTADLNAEMARHKKAVYEKYGIQA